MMMTHNLTQVPQPPNSHHAGLRMPHRRLRPAERRRPAPSAAATAAVSPLGGPGPAMGLAYPRTPDMTNDSGVEVPCGG
jgi:hypothetical protein